MRGYPTTAPRGFSLLEVLVALAISMIISAAMASLFAQSIKSRQQVDREGQSIENGRYALDAMLDDLRLAGFYGGFMPRGTPGVAWPADDSAGVTWTRPQPCELTVASMGWVNTVGAVTVPVHVMGYEAHPAVKTAAPVGLPSALTDCLLNHKSGTDVIVIRRASSAEFTPTIAASATTTTNNEVYLQASSCTGTQDGGIAFNLAALAAGGGNFTLTQLNCTSLNTIRRYIVRIYYIATCNDCYPSDTIPTLKVAELVYGKLDLNEDGDYADAGESNVDALRIRTRSLTPGIENMHFEYGVDGDGDGGPDSYDISNDDPITTTPGFNWQNVMSIKVYVVVRDFESLAGHTSSKEFVLGQRTIPAANNTAAATYNADLVPYKRNVFASTVRLVNPSAARELP